MFFVERGRDRSWSFAFPILDISIRSGDIRDLITREGSLATRFECYGVFTVGAVAKDRIVFIRVFFPVRTAARNLMIFRTYMSLDNRTKPR